jgi:N-acetylneuraminic acid mutarotase
MSRYVVRLAALAAFGLGLVGCSDERSVTNPTVNAPATVEGFKSLGELRTGYIYGRDRRPLKVTFAVHGELAVIDGDILLGPASAIATSPEQLRSSPRHVPGGPSFGVVIDGLNYRWPGGVVPYVIDPTLPSQSRVTDAIARIKAATPGVNLVPRSGQADYLRFVPSTGCSSYVGRIGGVQSVNLAGDCTTGNTMHEITHALGLYHEQSRCDRNGYVQILYANIQPGFEHNFDSLCLNATDLFAYAEGSIMHYGPYAFSANGQPTIRSLRGLDNLMGQRNGYGTTDVATINQLYPVTSAPWVTRGSMPTPRKQLAAGVVNGLLFAVGGMNGVGAVLTTVQAYNASTNAWTTKASLPAARWRTNGAATINNLMYVAGGIDGTTPGHTKTLYAYNAGSNTWSVKASMPVVGGCGGSGAIAGVLYVLIGCDPTTKPTSGAKGILLRYDPVANTWSTRTSTPGPHQFPAVAVLGGKLYVVGGKNGTGIPTTVVHVYSPSTNTWSTKTPLPSARYSSTAQVVAGKLYIVGGNDAVGAFTNTVYVYDPATNTWNTKATMPTARASLVSGNINGVLYSIGGYNSSSPVLATNEAFTP